MAEFDRLGETTDWIDLSFVERERTSREIIEKRIRYHLARLSLSNTVVLLDDLASNAVASLCTTGRRRLIFSRQAVDDPDHVAVDQKAIRVNGQQYWLYAAVDPATNRFLHVRLFPTYRIPIAREFLTELAERHDVADAVFLVDDADDFIGALRRENYSYFVQQPGFRNAVKCVFREAERRTSPLSNCFSHVDPAAAKTWLQAHAVWWNHI